MDQATGLIKKVSPKIARQINNDPDLIENVMENFNEIPQDKNGLIQTIIENGGMSTVETIEAKLNKHPWIKAGLNGFLAMKGTSIEQLKDEIQNNSVAPIIDSPKVQSNIQKNSMNSYKDRLSKLK